MGENKKRIYFTQNVVFGSLNPDQDSTIIFVNEEKGIRRMIVDSKGVIQNFPGYDYADMTEEEYPPQIRYRTSIEGSPTGRFYMLWEIQPSGMFSSDDGYGIEDSEEIILSAPIDENGLFTRKFRRY